MSQHYNTQGQVQRLLSAEAGLTDKMEKVLKSILFVFANGTTGYDQHLLIRLYIKHELIPYYLEK
jgi:hypothetical protein